MSQASMSMFLSKETFREAMRKGMEENPNFCSTYSDGEYAWYNGQQVPIERIQTFDNGKELCWFYKPDQSGNMAGAWKATFFTDVMQPLHELNEIIAEEKKERRRNRIKLALAVCAGAAILAVAMFGLTGCGSGATVDKVTDGIDASGVTPVELTVSEVSEDADEPEAEADEPRQSGGATLNSNGNTNTPPAASKPSSSSGSNGNGSSSGSSGSASTPSAPSHTHSWTYHEAVTEQVWISNKVWVGWYVCGHCGAKTHTSSDAKAHQREHIIETGVSYAYGTDGYYEDQGHYETRTVSAARYSCSCGAMK